MHIILLRQVNFWFVFNFAIPFLVLIQLFPLSLKGQEYRFKTYTIENGLQNELLKSITIDSVGFIWFATDGGLIRYNGLEFIECTDVQDSKYIKSVLCSKDGSLFFTTDLSFSKIDYGVDGFNKSTIRAGSINESDSLLFFPKQLYEDKNGNIWFSDNTSIYRFRDGYLKKYYLGSQNTPNSYNRSFSFFEDGYGNLYTISQTGHFYWFDLQRDKPVSLDPGFPITNVSAVLPISKNKVLIGANNMIAEFTLYEDHTFESFRILDPDIDASAFVMIQDSTFFVGSWSKGLYQGRLTGGNYEFTKIEDPSINKGGINQIILRGSDLYLATDNGLVIIQRKVFQSDFNNLTEEYIQDIAFNDETNEMFFTDGRTVFAINQFTLEASIVFNSTGSLLLRLLPDKNSIWVADNNGILRQLKDKAVIKTIDLSSYGSSIYNLTLDKNENIWICQDNLNGVLKITRDGLITKYGEESGLVSRVNFFIDSPINYIFLGACGAESYLYYFNPEQEKFINLSKPLPFAFNESLLINDLSFDEDGLMWLASNHGLLKVRGNDIERIDLENLTNEDIKAVMVGHDGDIWFASSIGVGKYNKDNIVTFDYMDGLPSKTIGYRCIETDARNRIWVGTLAGISYALENIPLNKMPKPVFLSISEKGQPLSNISRNSFSNLAYLGFTFISPSFPTDGIHYKVLLAGKDTTWRYFSGKNDLIYTDFKTGDYELIVQAKQRGNYLWSEPLSYKFHIYTIWYQSWWAWSILIAVIALFVYLTARWRSSRLEHEKQRLNILVSERTSELERKTREIEAKNEALVIAKDEAERSSKAKAEFLSTMSHEIRTPMNAVIGMTNILLMEEPRPEQLDRLNTLKFSAENLLMLINDILDFNKIEAGKVDFERIDFDLKEVARNIKLSFDPAANAKGIKLNLQVEEGFPDLLIGDPTRISQVIINLVGNALKFTEKGEINIILSKRLRPGNQLEVTFRIRDTGIGISPKKLETIFETFSQGSSNTTRRYGGTGLGLSITKKLLELMGSRIQVQSRLGVGSEFSFRLNLDISQSVKETKVVAANNNLLPSLKGYKILLVEDNLINIKIADQILKKWDIEVFVAKNGREAVNMFSPAKYHLILMDLHMPEMDGYEATVEIRKLDKNIPIIALTAAALVEDKQRVFAAGMNDFISKPFKPNDLYNKITKSILEASLNV